MSSLKSSEVAENLSEQSLHEIQCNMLHWEDAILAPSSRIIGAESHPPSKLKQLLNNAISQSTKKAYQSDLRHFRSQGGEIPCSPEFVAEYIASRAGLHKPATIARRLVSIGKAHRLNGYDNPIASDIVKLALRGLRRSEGSRQREAKPLLRDDLFTVLENIDLSLKGRRDIALLLLCFAGGFRRSEIVSLDVKDIEHVRQGVIIHLVRSKTDQEGIGRKIAIPFGVGAWCPVRALDAWISASGINAGALFRLVDRHSRISTKRLSGQAVSLVLKARAANAGFDVYEFSGHSLRAGFATSAALVGASAHSIRKQTGHQSDAMLGRYIRDADLFTKNATAAVL